MNQMTLNAIHMILRTKLSVTETTTILNLYKLAEKKHFVLET